MKGLGIFCIAMLAACGDCGSGTTDNNVPTNGSPGPDSGMDAGDQATPDAGDRDGGTDPDGGTSVSQLPGEPDDLAIDAMEDIDILPHPEDAWFGEAGIESNIRLTFSVEDDATVGEINALLAEHEATIVGSSSVGGWAVIDIEPDPDPDVDRLAEVRDAFNASPAILAAAIEFKTEPLILPAAGNAVANVDRENKCPDPLSQWEWNSMFAGSNWGLKFAQVPLAWNYASLAMEFDNAPTIGIIERAFRTGHPDVPALPDDTPTGPMSGDGNHGLEVASVMAANVDDVGVDGIMPIDVPLVGTITEGGDSNDLAEVEDLLRQGARIINNSNGILWRGVDPTSRRLGFGPVRRDELEMRGRIWQTTVTRVGQRLQIGGFLIVCGAGNEGVTDDFTYLARDTGGCNNAAVIREDPRFFAVENLATEGPNSFGTDLFIGSNREGNIAAPGACVGAASGESEYATVIGTSYSAPFVAASLAYLWSLAPTANPQQIRQALFDGAKAPSGVSSVRVDLYRAIQQLDLILGENTRAVALRDLDDGTLDGNLRVHPDGSTTLDTVNGTDGCVDMRDFRAMRDAMLVAADPTTTALDGLDDHPSRDLNGDGVVGTPVGQTGAAQDHEWYARYDLNGDFSVNELDMASLLIRFGECRNANTARTEGYTADDLSVVDVANGNVVYPMNESWDAWVKLPDATTEMWVFVTGAKGRWVNPANADEVYIAANGDRYAIVTAPVRCDQPRRACIMPKTGGIKCQTITDTPLAGNDVLLDPTTDAPNAQPGLMFWSDGVHQPPSFPAVFEGVMRWDGAQISPFAEVYQIDVGRYQTVTPDGNWGLFDACWSASGQFIEGECLQMQRLGVQDQGTFFYPPGNPGFLRIHDWMDDQKTLVLTGIEDPGDHHRTYLFDYTKAVQCTSLGGTVDCSDPNNNPYTRVPAVEDNIIGQFPGHALSGWVVYTTTDAVTRAWNNGSQVIGAQCRPPLEALLHDPITRNAYLSPAVPTPVSRDRYLMLKYFENGQWWLEGVTPNGSIFPIAPGDGRPHDYQAAWGPSGRTLAYHNQNQVVIADVTPDGTVTTRQTIGNAGQLTGASLSFGAGGEYLAAYVNDTGPDVGTLYVYRSSDGSFVGQWDHEQFTGLPAWSGLGDQIAVAQLNPDASRMDTDIVVIDLATGNTSNLTSNMQRVDCVGQMNCPYTNQYRISWNRSIDWRR